LGIFLILIKAVWVIIVSVADVDKDGKIVSLFLTISIFSVSGYKNKSLASLKLDG
jgi:hypothetical protein